MHMSNDGETPTDDFSGQIRALLEVCGLPADDFEEPVESTEPKSSLADVQAALLNPN